ncbi:hypothetical protein DRY87_25890, partial [Salmonella enterica subsp. enterica serovar Newport]|nr:hypothetical protein [Salmonella enterica subsp. enterica serovar Newport]
MSSALRPRVDHFLQPVAFAPAGLAPIFMSMDTQPAPFVPPAPQPRTSPPSTLEMMKIVYRNPLEL